MFKISQSCFSEREMDLQIECDVAIVGLGPTGATLANILGQYGWNVVGLERSQDVYYAPRAVHFDDEVMRVFQAIGLSDPIAKTSEPFREMEFAPAPTAEALLRFRVGSQDHRYGHAGAWWFHQPTLERQLREGLGRFSNVRAYYGAEVVGIAHDRDGVTVTCCDIQDERYSVRARYLIGCDGGKSFVRSHAKIALESAGFDQPWVVVDAKARCGGKEQTLPPIHRQICNPRQPTTYVPVGGPYYRWEFMVVDGAPEQVATDSSRVRKLLTEFVDCDKVEVIRTAYYTFHALWAHRWHDGRIILAGDAAHQMPPFLGQGMCSGIRDAHALGWRLNLLLSGVADACLLDSYEQERRRHVHDVIAGAVFLGRIIHTQSRMVALLRNWLFFRPLRMSMLLQRWFYATANRKRPLSNGFIGTNCQKLAGHLAIQPHVQLGDRLVPLDGLLGNDFALLSRAGSLDRADATIQELGRIVSLKHIEFGDKYSGAMVQDNRCTLSQWFDRHQVDFVLIRPDRYIFDAGKMDAFGSVLHAFQRHFPGTCRDH
jgi:3-(3-hydroxy-phenyl)propionate hydroxylase